MAQEYYALAHAAFAVREDTQCRVCSRLLGDGPVAHFPNGVLCHPRCIADPTCCPVTGKRF